MTLRPSDLAALAGLAALGLGLIADELKRRRAHRRKGTTLP